MGHCVFEQYEVHGCVHVIVVCKGLVQQLAQSLPTPHGAVLGIADSLRKMAEYVGVGANLLKFDVLLKFGCYLSIKNRSKKM